MSKELALAILAEHPTHLNGCQDHGCLVRKPEGMGTNGGRCRCDEATLGRALRWRLRQILRARDVLSL